MKRFLEQRIYEGEWLFTCRPWCGGFLVEYSFSGREDDAGSFLSNLGIHANERCRKCGEPLEWAGFSGGMPATESFLSLVETKHYMPATVILASLTEMFIGCLVFAALTDHGLSEENANKIANLRMGRYERVQICKALLSWPIGELSFPVRNLVAHGAGFDEDHARWMDDIVQQVAAIRSWFLRISAAVPTPDRFMPTQSQRWLLFMDHWSQWLSSNIESLISTAVSPSATDA